MITFVFFNTCFYFSSPNKKKQKYTYSIWCEWLERLAEPAIPSGWKVGLVDNLNNGVCGEIISCCDALMGVYYLILQ